MMFFEFEIYATFNDETSFFLSDVIEYRECARWPSENDFRMDIFEKFQMFSSGQKSHFSYMDSDFYTRTIRIPSENLLNIQLKSRFTTEDQRLMK